jgi:hypothetical protein
VFFTEDKLPARVYVDGNLAADGGGIVNPADDAADGSNRDNRLYNLVYDDWSRHDGPDGYWLFDHDMPGHTTSVIDILFFAVKDLAGLSVVHAGRDFEILGTGNIAVTDQILQPIAKHDFILQQSFVNTRYDERTSCPDSSTI